MNQQTPYSGWSKRIHSNGQAAAVEPYKDGKQDGQAIGWYHNGQKRSERTHKDNKLVTAVAWRLNGEKCPVTNVVNGNGGWVWYNDKGQVHRRWTFKDGKRVK